MITPTLADESEKLAKKLANPVASLISFRGGHNDICDASIPGEMLSIGNFQAAFLEAMEMLYSQNPPPMVVVSSLANVSELYNAGMGNDWCEDIWATGEICRVVTSGDTDYIAQADQRTRDYNDVLEYYAPIYGYTFVPETYLTEFTLDDLSDFDCFHPNVSGQNRIADIIWENGLNY